MQDKEVKGVKIREEREREIERERERKRERERIQKMLRERNCREHTERKFANSMMIFSPDS